MKLIKKWYDKFLKDMEKSNNESFGGKKLGCCGLNSNNPKKS